MKNTYTYTARSAENSEKVVTFTLHDDRMSVDIGTPVEQIAQMFRDESEENQVRVWLKPLAVSLIERGTAPLRIIDVDAYVDEAQLSVRSWVRLDGLRLAPVTLLRDRVDNPAAAAAFVDEVERRKAEARGAWPFLRFLDYWGTWIATVASLVALFTFWRRRSAGEHAA